MSASQHRRTCEQLGVCQDRPDCAAQASHDGEGHQNAVRIERLVNSRRQHTVLEPMPLHRGVLRSRAGEEEGDAEPPQREHAPRAFIAFWGCYLGLLIVLAGLIVYHLIAR